MECVLLLALPKVCFRKKVDLNHFTFHILLEASHKVSDRKPVSIIKLCIGKKLCGMTYDVCAKVFAAGLTFKIALK